ncbi:MAG: DUF4838 domain-containing protein, partial [bacterium]
LTNSMPSTASFEKRPELYSLNNGRRTKEQVCTTDPEVIELITQTVNEYFDKYPDAICYSLCPDDNPDFCECERCRAMDTGAVWERENKPIVTDRYVLFVSQVAERIQKRHPGKLVSMYAYINHSTPPIYMPVSPYVAVFFTTSVYCGGHGIGDTRCRSRMEMKSDLSRWAELCPNMYIYEYDPIPYNAELPWPLFGARAREMPLYRKMGIKGISIEGHCSWATLSPNHWVTAQCLWNADQSVESLLRDFCNGFFGQTENPVNNDIATAMFDYYNTLEQALARYEPKIEWGLDDIPKIYTPEIMRACRDSLDKAIHLANERPAGDVKERLAMVDIGFRYLERYLDCLRMAQEGVDFDTFNRAYTDCSKLIDQMTATNSDFIEVHSAYPGLGDGLSDIIATQYRKESGLVTTWNAIGPFDNVNRRGHDSIYPPELKIDLDATYNGMEGPVKWKVISTPEDEGYVNLLDHFSPNEFVTVYALNYLHVDRDVDVQLRIGSNDTLKVWLGGEQVWEFGSGRPAKLDEDIIPVHLKAGCTPVLLKISQLGLNWGFYFRVTDTEGTPEQDVKCTLSPNAE